MAQTYAPSLIKEITKSSPWAKSQNNQLTESSLPDKRWDKVVKRHVPTNQQHSIIPRRAIV